jgi:hypothetical protein
VITEDQVVALFAKLNPIPSLDDLDPVETLDPQSLMSQRDRSSIVSNQNRIGKRVPVSGRRSLVAALVIVVLAAVVAIPLLLRGNGGSVATPPTVTTTTPPTATTTTSVSGTTTVLRPQGRNGPGAHLTVMMPTGWETWPSSSASPSAITKGDPEPPGWMSVGAASVVDIYYDRCQWTRTVLDPRIGPTVEDLTSALEDVWGADAAAPIDATLDGFAGKQMVLTGPIDVDFATCDNGEFRRWPGQWYQGPGQKDRLWILDVEGERIVVIATFFPEGSAQDLAEMQAVIDSIQIEP